ncbi:CCAAT-binding transcription factor (CBF-B/NF-YA) subunit B (macronuclear) [Tetrahymena thermophila SB210]|uniref:Nuclear transcription factor Y subunit n=1 Tax=Tetrahymena thermophila (strain SB210) TaxID=312017 RepID=I7MCZ7_TETTS|nr:CCAAT-binding transcription factor (CBF-B/NF-YA) subunit B [Tetrahymena thermophila SB210]EAR85216.4 CCAAT-binding transcription factor (CBF-B/NF-YA) subunit B [Tetrahymena thermophila SB210]|eukprot:XP_001032879.4 CCAAT-binding transcription factor (CBF-B/NF-YA) subunit B [Tetrahymena thermophila SB210]
MSLEAQQIIRMPKEFSNINQDSIRQKGYDIVKNENSNQSSKQSIRKKKLSESIQSMNQKNKIRELDFLNPNAMKQNENLQLSQLNQQTAFQQNLKFEFLNTADRIKEESSLQGFADLQNQISTTFAIQKHHKVKQSNQLVNQNNNVYEKEVLPSQNYSEYQNERILNKSNTFQPNSQSIQNYSNSQNEQQKIQQFNKDKKQNIISKYQGDSLHKYSQISNEQQQQQQQQQYLFENDYIPSNMQKKLNQQYFDENNLLNNNNNNNVISIEAQQSDTKFSFNPNKINNTNSINPYINNTIFNHSSSHVVNDNKGQIEKEICPFNQLQQEIVSQTFALPPVIFTDEEPRYVNAAQFKRMMIMRIKRAARDLKQNKIVPQREIRSKETTEFQQQQQNPQKSKKYKYESRHKHATNRIRDSKGRFIPKDQLQEYLEQLEKEKKQKESLGEQNYQNNLDINPSAQQQQSNQIIQSNQKYNDKCNSTVQREEILQEQEEEKNQQQISEEAKQQNYQNNIFQISQYNQKQSQNSNKNIFAQQQLTYQNSLTCNKNENIKTISQMITEISEINQQSNQQNLKLQ